MTLANIDTVAKATPAAGDIMGRIHSAFTRKAVIVTEDNALNQDKILTEMCRLILETPVNPLWQRAVLYQLDNSSNLPTPPTSNNPTDAQIVTAVNQVWDNLANARRL